MTLWRKARKKPIIIDFREIIVEQESVVTLEGKLIGFRDKHFIIRGMDGELYPILKEIFYKTYDVLEDEDK